MKAGIAVCSDGLGRERAEQVSELGEVLAEAGIEAVLSPHIYAETDVFSASDWERAEDLMRFFRDDSVDYIFDISGGDLANGILPYLDYERIRKSSGLLWGYSDLTAVLNAVYAGSGRPSVLYQIRNLVSPQGALQRQRFAAYLAGDSRPLFGIRYEFIQGSGMEGILAGGNIRCFLKLAGTPWWPRMDGKILLLESFSGGSAKTAAMFSQLEQIGVFRQVSGILLGTFTAYEKADLKLSVYDLLKPHIPESLPVAFTGEVGHGYDAKAVMIGGYMKLGGQRQV